MSKVETTKICNFIINNNDILLLDNNFSVSIIIDDCINSEEVEIDFILVSVNNTNTLFNNLIYLNHIEIQKVYDLINLFQDK